MSNKPAPDRPTRAVGVHYRGDLRRALVEAAAATIADVGPDRLSLRDVARRLEVSHAAPAHHFGDRTGLLTAVATEGFHRFIVHMAEAVVSADHSAPTSVLLTLGRAYADFAERQSGYFDVMFAPAIIRAEDPAYLVASDAAFEAVRAVVENCQRAGWHGDDDNRALTAAAWAFAHGIAVLRRQGSLGRHYADGSLDGVAAIAATLLGRS